MFINHQYDKLGFVGILDGCDVDIDESCVKRCISMVSRIYRSIIYNVY